MTGHPAGRTQYEHLLKSITEMLWLFEALFLEIYLQQSLNKNVIYKQEMMHSQNCIKKVG
jgi:hypothetical protein